MAEKIRSIQEQLRQIRDLCGALRLFARTEGAETQVHSVELSGLLTEAVARYDQALLGKISFRLRSEASVEVRGSKELLRSVFDNIIENTIEAMPNGGSLVVGLNVTKGRPCVTFEDSGPGMEAEAVRRCLEPILDD